MEQLSRATQLNIFIMFECIFNEYSTLVPPFSLLSCLFLDFLSLFFFVFYCLFSNDGFVLF